MSAPVLLLLARGGVAEAPSRSAEALRDAVQAERPGLDVRLARSGQCLPTVTQTMKRIVRAGRTEVTVVGLDLTDGSDDPHSPATVAAQLGEQYPDLSITAAKSFGPEPSMLRHVDERLRTALAQARADELDALVLATTAAGDTRTQTQIARCARQWGQHHKLPVLVSHADGSGPSVTSAIRTLRGQGRRHIAVGSWFLTATTEWLSERDAALSAGATAVAEPIGAVEDSVRLVLARYAFAAMELLPLENEAPAPVVASFDTTSSGEEPATRPHLHVVGA